ncbi:MAG: efflux RND transporter permease subunit [Planctomycetota bacterium]
MNLSEICIRRPVFTWVLVLSPVVLGIFSYFELAVDLFPKVDFPVVSITASLPGASVEEVESSIVKPIEDAVNTVSGIDELRSVVREGLAIVIVQFVLSKNGDVGAQEVRDKISAIAHEFPEGTDPPVIDKFDLDAAPIMTIAVSGNRDARELTEIVEKRIQEPLQSVFGVGSVFMSGGRERAINIVLNTDLLAAYGLSIEDVRRAVVAENLEVPGGLVQQGPREMVLRTLGRIEQSEKFNNLIIANRNGFPIRVRDVGRVEDSIEEPRSLTTLDGETAVSLFVRKQSGSNTVAVVDRVLARLDEIKAGLPADIETEVIQDQSRFIRNSMEEVKFHLLLAGALVSGTILLFIRDWRTTLIATLAIPTSIIPTFAFMHVMGFSLDNISMLALILAIGIVIDDAVVVHENIFRHMEEDGMDAMTAARVGTKEIALPVMATSLSLVVIFVPIAFMGGMVGRFFSSFGLTIAFAVLMSLFVSFTLTPMLCSRFLKLEPAKAGHSSSKSGFIWRAIDGFYGRTLTWSIAHRFAVLVVCAFVLYSTGPIARVMGVNFLPRDDQSEFQVKITTPEGYSLERSRQVFAEIESRLKELPGIERSFVTVGETDGRSGKGQGDVTKGSIYLRMTDLRKRDFSQFDVMRQARTILADYPDLRTAVSDVSIIHARGDDNRPFQMNIIGPDLEQLAGYADELKQKLGEVPGMADVDSTLSLRKPELRVEIDRDRASDLGISVHSIASTLRILVGGQIVSQYKEGTEPYDVWLRAEQQFRATPQALEQITIPSPKAGLVQLTNVARLEEAKGPSQIDRLQRQRSVTILGNPDGIPLQDATNRAMEIIKELKLPPEYTAVVGGQSKTMQETAYYFLVALFLSVLFMYLILAAQFESWFDPVAILAALPVTIPFGLLSLVLFRSPMDIYAMFGLFMLIGIVKKNGILQVEKTNELRRAGLGRDEAILEANRVRLRPILMTTVMLIAAMVPIALGQGPGAAARASMAKVIIGGQTLSLLLALLVTPVTYSVMDVFSRWLDWLRGAGRGRFEESDLQVDSQPDNAGDDDLEALAADLAATPAAPHFVHPPVGQALRA